MTDWLNKTHVGDCRDLLVQMAADGVKVQTCVTSPPYFGLRDYGKADQIGLESDPMQYVAQLVVVFDMVRDVLAADGTLWLNLGDTYSAKVAQNNNTPNLNRDGSSDASSRAISDALGSRRLNPDVPAKNLLGIPWRVAFALQANGWYLRQDIIWHKPNPMPESVTDRCTKAHEYLFLLAKSERYYYDAVSIAEPAAYPGDNRATRSDTRKLVDPMCQDGGSRARTGQPTGESRNRRSVWTITTKPFKGAHFATFPRDLIQPCILAGSRPGDVVLDPFMGSGTTAEVSTSCGRQFIGCELNPEYAAMTKTHRSQQHGMAI